MGAEILAAFAAPGYIIAALVGVVGFRATRNGRNGDLPPELVRDISEIKAHLVELRDLTRDTCMILQERLPRP